MANLSSNSIDEVVRNDIQWLKEQSLMRRELAANTKGFVFDIGTGKLRLVE